MSGALPEGLAKARIKPASGTPPAGANAAGTVRSQVDPQARHEAANPPVKLETPKEQGAGNTGAAT